jgi:hypothetical protein
VTEKLAPEFEVTVPIGLTGLGKPKIAFSLTGAGESVRDQAIDKAIGAAVSVLMKQPGLQAAEQEAESAIKDRLGLP